MDVGGPILVPVIVWNNTWRGAQGLPQKGKLKSHHMTYTVWWDISMKHLLMYVYQVCSNKSPGVKICPASGGHWFFLYVHILWNCCFPLTIANSNVFIHNHELCNIKFYICFCLDLTILLVPCHGEFLYSDERFQDHHGPLVLTTFLKPKQVFKGLNRIFFH
jgi:hypothetical protein